MYIKEKYDPYQKKFYEEMKVVTPKSIFTYARYTDYPGTVQGAFKPLGNVPNPLGVINLTEFKTIQTVTVTLKLQRRLVMLLIVFYLISRTRLNNSS